MLLLNILLASPVGSLSAAASPGSFIMGFGVGFVLLALLHRAYGRRFWALRSSCSCSGAFSRAACRLRPSILRASPAAGPGHCRHPADGSSDFEIATLATSITLTPGTLSVDVGWNTHGQRVLYVHNLVMGDPDAMRREIKEEFERRILRFTRRESLNDLLVSG